MFQYWFSWPFDSTKLLLNEANENFELWNTNNTKFAELTEALKKLFFHLDWSTVFAFLRAKTLVIWIFRKCQLGIVFIMLFNVFSNLRLQKQPFTWRPACLLKRDACFHRCLSEYIAKFLRTLLSVVIAANITPSALQKPNSIANIFSVALEKFKGSFY